jgi:hypothetical protein
MVEGTMFARIKLSNQVSQEFEKAKSFFFLTEIPTLYHLVRLTYKMTWKSKRGIQQLTKAS